LVDIVAAFGGFDGIIAGTSTREGCVSGPPYEPANTALHVSDRRAAVLEDRSRICSELSIDAGDLVCAEQVHGSRVARVAEGDRGRGAIRDDEAVRGVDGLVTDLRELPLAIFTADCVPVFVYEATKEIVGIAHAGWRGTFLRIAGTLIEELEGQFGADPRSCFVALGPSAGPCCYEVGDEVVSAFQEKGHPESIFSHTEDGKFWLDMWQANALQLEERGVPRGNISCPQACTVCSDRYFSCRRDGAVTGRNMSVIMLR
jgi:YfiH family protein